TGERAPPELRAEIKKREFTVREWIINEKDAPVLAGTNDLQDERQTQVMAIHGIKMTEAGIAQLIYDDKKGVMNSLLSANHAMRIIAGDAQQRRELAIVPQIAREVLKSGGGVTTLLGDESRKKVEDVMKHAKLITTKENTPSTPGPVNTVNELQLQQQVPLFNRRFHYQGRFRGNRAQGSFVPFNSWGYNQYQPNQNSQRNLWPETSITWQQPSQMWSYGQGGLGNTQQFSAQSPQGQEQPQTNLILGQKRIPQPLNYPRNPRLAIEGQFQAGQLLKP
ncbi:MAG: hypothetical protein EZS28_039741, partial [Streblomastix strix]